jgi:hypothetical protein
MGYSSLSKKAAVHSGFGRKKNTFFKDRIQNLVEYWQKCIEVGGDYVEQ